MTIHPVSASSRPDYPRLTSVAKVNFNEMFFGLNLDKESQKIFSIFDSQLRFLPYDSKWQAAVTFEFWDTLKVYHRIDYGLLDWLSDIGGLYNILSLVFLIVLSWYIGDGPSFFVASDMISGSMSQDDKQAQFRKKKLASSDDQKSVQHNCCFFMRLRLVGTCCIKGNRRDRFLAAAYDKVHKSFDVAKLLKKVNVLHGL